MRAWFGGGEIFRGQTKSGAKSQKLSRFSIQQ